MHHFGVELQREQTACWIGHGRDRARVGFRKHFEAGWQSLDLVAVAHPDIEFVGQVLEKGG